MRDIQVILPNWRVPNHVHAYMTTRVAGYSQGVYGQADGQNGLNLATHVGDELSHILQNRALLKTQLNLPSEPLWLNQTHSTYVHLQTLDEYKHEEPPPEADAVVLTAQGQVGVVMTADCLPVLFASADGKVVGAAHAGWRGLADGVLEKTIQVMREQGAHDIQAWLGAAIGSTAFEVGRDVLDEFTKRTPAGVADVGAHFKTHPCHLDKYLANIYGLAFDRLQAMGITEITGGKHCTVSEKELFYSYRRDGVTGRMATIIWMEN
ncbi:peptidoglycan editing factor PgeF [Hydromonas duriensis]|uniref:Purine nucleoside phosphorylase n=1 Tax=Hydromonas duriensis TaxID=1527608 RepID=A0A4R6Y6X1_9BURK|nr:peptidoglycan editing factor PgeF [Hydromonas duriensis]TDR29028.1 hypothetical protein DFR44_12819 [Hydromonas duriensis]